MTYSLTTTPPRATEALRGATQSFIATLFSRLNGALAVATEAERDITDVDIWDPAVNSWLREAERAWDVVVDLRRALRDAPVTRAGERALLSMARIAGAVMDSGASRFLTAFAIMEYPVRPEAHGRPSVGGL